MIEQNASGHMVAQGEETSNRLLERRGGFVLASSSLGSFPWLSSRRNRKSSMAVIIMAATRDAIGRRFVFNFRLRGYPAYVIFIFADVKRNVIK